MSLKGFKYSYWLLILLLIIIDVISTGLIKQSAVNVDHYYLYGMVGFFISGYVLYILLGMGKLATINAVWDIVSIILISIIGIIYFKESYDKYHMIGLILAIVSLFFINYSEIRESFLN
jgi:small multidrug resistance pump